MTKQPEKLSARTKMVMAFAILFLITFLIGGGAFLACRGIKNALDNPRPANTAAQTQPADGK